MSPRLSREQTSIMLCTVPIDTIIFFFTAVKRDLAINTSV